MRKLHKLLSQQNPSLHGFARLDLTASLAPHHCRRCPWRQKRDHAIRCLFFLLIIACPCAWAQSAADIARQAMASGRYQEAERLALSDSESAEAQFLLWQLYTETPLGSRGRAGRALSRAIALDPDNADYRAAQIVHLRRDRMTYVQNEYLQYRRMDLARDLLRIDSANAVAHEELGLQAARDFDDVYQHAAMIGAPEGIRQSLAAQQRQVRAYVTATEGFERAIRVAPERASAYRPILRIYARTEQWTEVLRVAKQMTENVPRDGNAWIWLGLAEQRLGNDRLADQAFTQGLALLPFDEAAIFVATEFVTIDGNGVVDSGFWDDADPLLLTPYNERLLAHHARIALADLLYAAPQMGLRGWETRRGQTFIRYGPPNTEQILSPSGTTLMQVAVWEYDHARFVFEDEYRNGEFRLASPSAQAIALGLADGYDNDFAMMSGDIARELPQQYTFSPAGLMTGVYTSAASFRGAEGKTDLVVAYGVPIHAVTESIDEPLAQIGVFVGSGVGRVERRDTVGNRIALLEEVDGQPVFLRQEQVSVNSGVRQLSVEAIGLDKRTTAVGRSLVEVRRFEGGFDVSDVLFAYAVEEAYGEAPSHPAYVTRGDVRILAAPTTTFDRSRPLYLYFEIYGLTRGEGEVARYELEIDLSPQERGGLSGLLSRDERGVSVRFPGTVAATETGTYQILDVSGQKPGRYDLTLIVRDAKTGDEQTRNQSITLR